MEKIQELIKQMPTSWVGKSTLISVVIEAILIIALESVVASMFLSVAGLLNGTPAEGIPVYLIIFLMSQAFQVVLVFDAVLHQNTIQIVGFVIFNGCCFAYSIFQYNQLASAVKDAAFSTLRDSINSSALSPYLVAIIIIIGLFELFYLFLAYKLYLEFGWKIYKKIGADPQMKNMFRTYQIFLMILKLDFFFFLAFSIQFLVLVLNPSDPEFGLTIFAIPATVLVLALAVYGLKRENGYLMSGFILGCLLAIAYFIFKLARMYEKSQEYKYLYTRNFLTFFATLSLLVVIMTLINAVVCFMNFGKGLKQHILVTNDPNAQQEQGVVMHDQHDRKMTLTE